MSDTTTDDLGTPAPARPSRLNQALAWVGIVAGGLFVVGAIFFSGYFLNENKKAKLALFCDIPADRLLVETDAPAMPLPPDRIEFPLPQTEEGLYPNHPANIRAVYRGLAELRQLPEQELAAISIAFLNLEALGGITRLKAQSGVAGAEIRRRHQPWVARTDTQNRPASPIDSAAFLEGKVWNSLFES